MDGTVGPLPPQHEVDAGLDRGPQMLEAVDLAGRDVPVPCSGGQVGAHIGVEPRILDPGGQVVVEPAAVGELGVHQPLVGPVGLFVQADSGEGHGRLDVVPRVAVPAGEPRDHPVRALQGGDGLGGGHHLAGRHDSGNLGDRPHATASAPAGTRSPGEPSRPGAAGFSR